MGERENEIRRLYEDIHKLEQIRDRQAVKINSLQERIHSVDDEASRSLISSDNAVRTLSNELRFLKETLQQVTAREQSVGSKTKSNFCRRTFLNEFFFRLVNRFSSLDWQNARPRRENSFGSRL